MRGKLTNKETLYCHWCWPWRSWLRHCATSWKVAGSIPDGFSGIFHLHNPSSALWPWGRLSLKQK